MLKKKKTRRYINAISSIVTIYVNNSWITHSLFFFFFPNRTLNKTQKNAKKRKKTYNTFYSRIKRESRITHEKNVKRNLFLQIFFFTSLLYRIIFELYPNHEFLTSPHRIRTICLSLWLVVVILLPHKGKGVLSPDSIKQNILKIKRRIAYERKKNQKGMELGRNLKVFWNLKEELNP